MLESLFVPTGIVALAEIGDKQGARMIDGKVVVPDGWDNLYRAWAEGGWNSLTAAEEFGGQALPHMLNVAALEMWNSGSMAFALAPTLTMGAVEALVAHGSDDLKRTYLPKLVSGEWLHEFETLSGWRYRLEGSEDLVTWIEIGAEVTGTGSRATLRAAIQSTSPHRFFRIKATR